MYFFPINCFTTFFKPMELKRFFIQVCLYQVLKRGSRLVAEASHTADLSLRTIAACPQAKREIRRKTHRVVRDVRKFICFWV